MMQINLKRSAKHSRNLLGEIKKLHFGFSDPADSKIAGFYADFIRNF